LLLITSDFCEEEVYSWNLFQNARTVMRVTPLPDATVLWICQNQSFHAQPASQRDMPSRA
jgi:hypothetical protein